MVHVIKDRVLDTSTTTGTGAFTLAAAPPTGYRTFSAVCSNGDTVPYCIEHTTNGEWETGLGTYSASNTLTRTTVIESSNSNSAVNFSAGSKNVFIDITAASIAKTIKLEDGSSIEANGGSRFVFSGNDIEAVRHLFKSLLNPGLGTTAGWMLATSGNGHFAATSAPLYSNRISSDGILVDLRKDGASQGNLTIASGTVTLTAFSGSHWGRFGEGDYKDIKLGTIIDAAPGVVRWKLARFTIDGVDIVVPYHGPAQHGGSDTVLYGDDQIHADIEDEEPSQQLVKHVRVEVNSKPMSTAVYGVFAGYCDEAGWNDVLVTGVGNFWIRMAAGQAPVIGDLVEADGNGCGVVQGDTIFKASTVGKITGAEPQLVYEDGSYLVPCVLYCG